MDDMKLFALSPPVRTRSSRRSMPHIPAADSRSQPTLRYIKSDPSCAPGQGISSLSFSLLFMSELRLCLVQQHSIDQLMNIGLGTKA